MPFSPSYFVEINLIVVAYSLLNPVQPTRSHASGYGTKLLPRIPVHPRSIDSCQTEKVTIPPEWRESQN